MKTPNKFQWKPIYNLTFFILHCCIARAATELSALWPTIAQHPAWDQLDKVDCGISAADRIIGGQNAVLGQFPWIVRLGYSTAEDHYEVEWLCGGVLVTPRHVVTAAHCAESHEDDLSVVRVGEHDILRDPDCQVGVCAPRVQDIPIQRIRMHPQFSSFHHDIAILDLAKPAQLNDYVSPICMPKLDEMNVELGEMLTVAGWGKMNMTTEQRARILQFVQVPLLSPEACGIFHNGFKMSDGELCAGARINKDACGGDSGGPLMKVFDTMDGPKYYLVGVVSFGPTLCGSKKPGVYTSVAYYEKWILDHLI